MSLLHIEIDREFLRNVHRKHEEFVGAHIRGVKVAYVILVLVLIGSFFAFNAPRNFPTQTLTTIEDGSTLTEVASMFESQNYVGNAFWLKVFVTLRGGQGKVHSGDYFFGSQMGPLTIANRIATGDFRIGPVKVVIPEGSTVIEMSEIFSKELTRFDPEKFVKKAIEFEGYLFPDTYLLLQNVKEDEVIRLMLENFDTKIEEITDEIEAFGRSLTDVIIMASLVEEEARLTQTHRTIAGILWSRIDIGMALQVDAVFPYIIGKNTFEVTLEDLKVDSPYNTYKYKGLPVGPISNPGLNSILATVTPIETNYLFYLSDLDGNMHYARDFEQHKVNKSLYLR